MDAKQKAMLRVALSTAFGDYDSLRRFLLDACELDLNQHTHPTVGLETACDVAIEQCIAKGKSDDLLQNLANHTNPDTNSIASMLQQQLAKSRQTAFPHTLPDPFSTLFLGGEACFIGREALRRELRKMQGEHGRSRVLVVNGNKTCGKTYTYDLVRQLDSVGDRNIIVKIDYYSFREGALEARYQDIVQTINTRMNVPSNAMPTPFESPTRLFQNSIRKFDAVAREQQKCLWLVFDHFGASETEDKIADALASTAILALDETKALYVVLIDVDPARLKLEVPISRRLLKDSAALPEYGDLVTFLKQAREAAFKLTVSDAEIEQAAAEIMDSLQTYNASERAYEYSQLTCKSARQLGFLP